MTIHAISKFGSTTFRKGVFAFGVALSALGMGLSGAAQHVTTFDAPGAGTAANQGTVATGINVRGASTGSVTDAGYGTHGFVRTGEGEFTIFDAPGADPVIGCTCPQAINDFGVVAGYDIDSNGFSHGFVRSPEGKFTTFDVPGTGGIGSIPVALNSEGAVVGYYTDSNYVFYSFLRNPDGSFKTFSGPDACDTGFPTGCYANEATNINFWGTIVGNYADSNFIEHSLIRRPDGKLITFDAPGAGALAGSYQGTGCPGCYAGFNIWGAIAATYTDANNVHHGFVRNPDGKFTTFDAPGAGTGSYQGTGCSSDCPVSLNGWGAITGVYIDANYVYHGYLRSPEGKFSTVDPSGSVGTVPFSINDFGAITGDYLDANNVYHGFIRVP